MYYWETPGLRVAAWREELPPRPDSPLSPWFRAPGCLCRASRCVVAGTGWEAYWEIRDSFFFLVVEVSMEWNILWSYTWEQRASKGGRTKQWITSKHSTAGVWGFYFPTLTLQKTKANQQWKGRSQRGSLRPDPGAPLQSRVWKRQACWTGTAHGQTGRDSLTFTTIVCITLLQGNLKMQTFSYSGQNSDMCWVWILYLSERHVSSTAKVHYHHLLNLMCNSLRISEMRFYSKINKF